MSKGILNNQDWEKGSPSGEFLCKYCQANTFRLLYIEPHIGLYCSECGKWIRWIKK